MFEIRPLERSDIPETVKGWNQVLIHDKVSEHQFEDVIFGDPNYERECNLVAVEDGRIAGFIGAVARKGTLGKDRRGRPSERHYGYIKGFFVLDDYWDTGIERKLLNKALECLRSRSKRSVWVARYTGKYFYPGTDVRYERLQRFFDENGFTRMFTINDVAADLRDFEPSEYQRKAKMRAEEIGVEIMAYRPEMLSMMREFVDKLNMRHWFPDAWEKDFGKGGHSLIACRNDKIVGWTAYCPNKPSSEVGGIAVLEDYRRKGIGTSLLLESMLRLKEFGVSKVVAGWAATEFYLKSGWKICRQYIVYRRRL
jgi:GNAT superfamily N-acetyltransferase